MNTTKPKFTPGPCFNHDSIAGRYHADLGWAIASSAVFRMTQATFQRQAILADAAPELMDALIVLVQEGECYCLDSAERQGRGPCGHCVAKAALAKARGEA